ncbi:trypsin-like peptidase domain-containing protein [Spartinivicinus poritis]|uniref:Serine protease n=1 Tax=Spartinivicinus poritis TaxID=2994640 RepID=A0ABT5UE16_9GAMM|nr:trypsin-like peptidase domain-containing protein [Spartinivicinus sp. A2-2]MDE1463723.1 trypsin-like peptidase domain-containing protein [Spartinivicinus sp. A2-2]
MSLPKLHPFACLFTTLVTVAPFSYLSAQSQTDQAAIQNVLTSKSAISQNAGITRNATVTTDATIKENVLTSLLSTKTENNTTQTIEASAQPQIIKIADKVVTATSLVPNQSLKKDQSHTIQEPGASFIKIHFSAFSLPKNSQVIVSNPDGSEAYRYGNSKRDNFTFDPDNGEDGKQAWASMSISGDTAIVKVETDPKYPWVEGKHQLKIGHYWKGYPEEVVEELIQTRSTCGKMQRKDAVCYKDSHPTEYAHTKPVARLVMGGGLCTAWRVSADNRMFTNNHCMSTQSKVSNSEVWFNYQRSQCGGGQKNKVVKVSGDKMLKTSRSNSLDYTLFTVKDFNSIKSFSYLGLDVREPQQNEDIYIAQHGAGNPKELSIEDDQNSRNRCQVDKPTSSRSNLGYKCDTTGGSSGSPVLANKSHKVIGLHHWGGCPSGTNSAAKIKDIWPEVAEHFNNKVPADGVGGNPNPNPDPDPNPNPNPNPKPNPDKFKPLSNKLNACLGVNSSAKINASSCQNDKSQQWELDTKGLLHPASAPEKCLQMPQWWKGSNRAVIGSCDSKQLHQRWQLKQGRLENLAYPMIYLKHFKAYGDWVGVWTKDNAEGAQWQWK